MSAAKPPRRRRRWTWRVALVLTGACAIFIVVGEIIPLKRYSAYCRGEDVGIDGPYRERFLLLTGWHLRNVGIRFAIFHGNIYTAGWPEAAAFPDVFHDFFDYQLNSDWRTVEEIAQGVTIDGAYFPPPKRLVRLIYERQGKYGPYYGYDEIGRSTFGSSERFAEDCELFKAAILPEPNEALPGRRWEEITIRPVH